MVPADWRETPLRHGWASRLICQRPSAVCSTLPVTAANASGFLSSPSLKFTRPSLTSIFARRFVAASAEAVARGLAGDTPSGANEGGSQRSRFQRPSALLTRIKLGRSSDNVPNSKRPARRPSNRKRADKRSARKKYSFPNAGSSPTVIPSASRLGSGRSDALKVCTSTRRPNVRSRRAIIAARTRCVRKTRFTLNCSANTKRTRATPHFQCFRSLTKRYAIAFAGNAVKSLAESGAKR